MVKFKINIFEEIVESPELIEFKTKKGKIVRCEGRKGARANLVELSEIIKTLKSLKSLPELNQLISYLDKKEKEIEDKWDLGLFNYE